MQVATWNIRHGGAAGANHQRVIGTLLGFDADLLVITEYRPHDRGLAIEAALRGAGYLTTHPGSPPNKNAVLIASRTPIANAAPLDPTLAEPSLLWAADLPWGRVGAVYMPGMKRKLPYWDAILTSVSRPGAPALLIGDFNTGRNDLDKADGATAFIGSEYMARMEDAGYADLWRSQHPARREYSWFSKPWNNGFRLDHAFGNRRIAAQVKDCRYDHTPREAGISDHSALLLELAVEP